jgi:hypothetical protein
LWRSKSIPRGIENWLRFARRRGSRRNAAAETVIGALEDAEDYKVFEAAIIADYDAQSAVERELVLRLASLLWRLRRATAMETGLLDIQAEHLNAVREARRLHPDSRQVIYAMFGVVDEAGAERNLESPGIMKQATTTPGSGPNPDHAVVPTADLARCYLRLANLPNYALDRLSRYEVALWRQVGLMLFCARCFRSPQTTRETRLIRTRVKRRSSRWPGGSLGVISTLNASFLSAAGGTRPA